MTRTKAIVVFLVIAAAVILGQFFHPRQSAAEEPGKFTDKQHLVEYIKTNMQLAGLWNNGPEGHGILTGKGGERAPAAVGSAQPALRKAATGAVNQAASDDAYSTTNIQVEGVDEADIIKNDGRYLYTVSGGRVHILEAYPAEKARVLSTIRGEGRPTGIDASHAACEKISH